MNEILSGILGNHRFHVRKFRVAYRNALREHRQDPTGLAHTAVRSMHYKLAILKPLLRAFEAVIQQLGTPVETGAEAYRKRYDAFVALIRDLKLYEHDGRCDLYLGDGVQSLLLMVPNEGAPDRWSVRSISAIVLDVFAQQEASRQQCQQEQDARRNARIAPQRQQDAARKAFLNSLTAEQRTLLQQAMTAAVQAGCADVRFAQADL